MDPHRSALPKAKGKGRNKGKNSDDSEGGVVPEGRLAGVRPPQPPKKGKEPSTETTPKKGTRAKGAAQVQFEDGPKKGTKRHRAEEPDEDVDELDDEDPMFDEKGPRKVSKAIESEMGD